MAIHNLIRRAGALAIAWVLLMCDAACAVPTRDEVRGAYRAITEYADQSPYARLPVIQAPYETGELTQEARQDALNYLNFMRWLAGVAPVVGNRLYDDRCQRAAVLLAALDYVAHDAPNPGDMDAGFYESACLGTRSSSIARLNWQGADILRKGIAYFLRDDGEDNLTVLGHRRWALNPIMAATGFGLAASASGASYVVMYAHDLGSEGARWQRICWPAAGAFPAELMHTHLCWSVMLNPEEYDIAASVPVVELTEERESLHFRFEPLSNRGDGDCAVNMQGYGAGPCIIFRPDFSRTGFSDYRQNQRWQVGISGLKDAGGGDASIEYTVEMISLHVEDVAAVELTQIEAALSPGESMRLGAEVVPDYADDLAVDWFSTDETVAAVDALGEVTAIAPGACEIVAASANGREDRCSITVKP